MVAPSLVMLVVFHFRRCKVGFSTFCDFALSKTGYVLSSKKQFVIFRLWAVDLLVELALQGAWKSSVPFFLSCSLVNMHPKYIRAVKHNLKPFSVAVDTRQVESGQTSSWPLTRLFCWLRLKKTSSSCTCWSFVLSFSHLFICIHFWQRAIGGLG